jgi:hypothetical protein
MTMQTAGTLMVFAGMLLAAWATFFEGPPIAAFVGVVWVPVGLIISIASRKPGNPM